MDDNTPAAVRAVHRMFELHLLPDSCDKRVLDITPSDIRRAVSGLIDAGKIPTGMSLHIYANAIFVWAARRKPGNCSQTLMLASRWRSRKASEALRCVKKTLLTDINNAGGIDG
jgi:hypothetical protein